MSDFKLSNGLNKNKVFLVRRSEIEGRLDPLYYSTIEKIQSKIVSRSKYDVSSVKNECNIIRGRFGHRPRNDPAYYNGKYPFIQTGDVVIASDSGEKIKYSQTLNELGLSTSKLFKANQLLFTIAANIGDTAILDYDACFPDSIVSIEPKNSNTSIEYLNIYFKLIKPYIYDLAPFAAQRNLNNKQLEEVPIIIPPISLQTEIINLFNDCIKTRQSKQSQSKALLKSIDSYLLNELGIELPKKDDSLKARIFTTKFSAVCGNRLDPFYVKNESNKMKSKSFEEIALGDMAVIEKGQTITSDEIIEGCFPVIAGGQTSPYNHNVYNYKENCITISASGAYAGYVWYHETPIFASDCLVVYSNDEEKMSTLFLSEILKLKQSEIYDMQQGAGQPHVYAKDIYSIQIPLPPLSKQIEIADHIKQIRQQAKQLEIEAEQILTDAKKEIEKMILGE